MRSRHALVAALIALGGAVGAACGDDGADEDGAGGGGAVGTAGSGTAATGTNPGSGSAGDGGSAIDGPSSVGTASGAGASDSVTTTGVGAGPPEECLGANLLGELGGDRVLVGASLGDELSETTPLDLRYVYLSGALPDGDGPCDSCAASCSAAGDDCSNQGPGCGWWGCWQYDQEAPGAYVRTFAETARARGQIPMVTYYLVLQSSGATEGAAEVAAVADATYLARYLADFRFVLQQLGEGPALVHVEPDFWGYAQQSNPDPHAIPAAVPAANPGECGDQEASIAGLGRCMVQMARIHAPDVKIGLHGSGWATALDVLQNADPGVDILAHATALGGFLAATAPDADLVFIDAADRDAGYYTSIGRETWWDDTNTTLPSFHQAFAWSSSVSEALGRPNLWWQLPFGNMSLSGEPGQWNDNRVGYFFEHMDEVAAAHGVGVAFGAGADGQVTAETDGGYFVERASSYAASGGQPLCAP